MKGILFANNIWGENVAAEVIGTECNIRKVKLLMISCVLPQVILVKPLAATYTAG